ncbi:MAG: hypothetical protein KJ749_02820, partial [Planctomycetes bacterium]|nr:hypothetical protein [Planctomycetota bacterium]
AAPEGFGLHKARLLRHNAPMPNPVTVAAPDQFAPGVVRGSITLLCGCMFSGKTTELLERLAGCPARSRGVFKHVIDRRYRLDAVVSHNGDFIAATRVSRATEILDYVGDPVTTVAVDEGHFFDSALPAVLDTLTSSGINVVVTALDLDSWGRPFPAIQQLMAVADKSFTKRAVCARCGEVANRTQRLTPIVDGDLIGRPDCYEPRCRACWRPPGERPMETA